jgi:hypothetical protein
LTVDVLDKPTTTTGAPVPPLTWQDTCEGTNFSARDRRTHDLGATCGAAGAVRAVFPSGSSLVFCSHHGTEYEPTLAAGGATLHDANGQVLSTTGDPAAPAT